MKEPVDHIERPRLPWRADEPGMTECGLNATKVKTISRMDFFGRLLLYGQQRTAILTCMTCYSTANRWTSWDEDPRQAMAREVAWEGSGRYCHNERGMRLRNELRAIEQLIKKHRADFDWLLLHFADQNDRTGPAPQQQEKE